MNRKKHEDSCFCYLFISYLTRTLFKLAMLNQISCINKTIIIIIIIKNTSGIKFAVSVCVDCFPVAVGYNIKGLFMPTSAQATVNG